MTSGVHFESPVRVNDIEQDVKGVIVKGERRGRAVSYKARMVIIATRANVKLLLQMGLLKKPPLMMLCARAYFEGLSLKTILKVVLGVLQKSDMPSYCSSTDNIQNGEGSWSVVLR